MMCFFTSIHCLKIIKIVVKADDFVYSFNRLTDKAVSSPGAWVMNNVDYYEAINDSTFFIRLKTLSSFLGLLTMPIALLYLKKLLKILSSRCTNWYRSFRFQYWKENVKLVLRKMWISMKMITPDAIAITFIKISKQPF